MHLIVASLSRHMRLVALVAVTLAVGSAGAGGCGSDKETPKPGTMCTLNSECNNPLSCTFGKCHQACVDARDCPGGQRCIKAPNGNACLLAEEERCVMNSDCKDPLVCGRDLKCRNQCKEDRDCPTRTQRCIVPDNVCAEQTEITEKGELKGATGTPGMAGTSDAGPRDAASQAGAGGAGGRGGTAGTGGGAPADAATADRPATADAAAGGSDRPRVVPDAIVPVEGVMAMPAILRQGDSGKIVVTGKGLAGAGDVRLDDLLASVEPGGTDTTFTISVVVPHAVKLGPKNLTFTTSSGSGGKDAVLTISGITSGPMGNDATGRGTTDSPYRSLKKALQTANAGDTVSLLDGEYTMAAGETWMQNVPAKVTIEGQSAAGTKLVGAMGGANNANGLVFDGDATVRRLTVTTFQYNIRLNKPGLTIALEDVKSTRSANSGLQLDGSATGAKVTITGKDSELTDHNYYAVTISAPMTTLVINTEGSIGTATNYAPFSIGAMKPTIDITGATLVGRANTYNALSCTYADCTVKLNKVKVQDTINVSGMNSTLEIVDSTIAPMAANQTGVTFGGQKMTVTNTTIENVQICIAQNGVSGTVVGEVIARSLACKYARQGFYLSAGKLDLGNDKEKGNNTFTGPDNDPSYTHAIYDYRGPTTEPITVSNTTLNNNRPNTGPVEGPQNVAGRYYIRSPKNVIQFYLLP
jgi:hypothetical protein